MFIPTPHFLSPPNGSCILILTVFADSHLPLMTSLVATLGYSSNLVLNGDGPLIWLVQVTLSSPHAAPHMTFKLPSP